MLYMTKTCLNFFASISIDSTIPVVNLLGSVRLLPRYQLPHLPAMATASDSGTSTATWSATWSDLQTSSSDFASGSSIGILSVSMIWSGFEHWVKPERISINTLYLLHKNSLKNNGVIVDSGQLLLQS